MARTSGSYRAAVSRLEQQVAPGDQIVARFWALTGWSMNWWIAAIQVSSILLVLPFMFGLRPLYDTTVPVCGTATAVLTASWWTRPALMIALTRQGQLLCCRISRPFHRKTITQAPAATVWLALSGRLV